MLFRKERLVERGVFLGGKDIAIVSSVNHRITDVFHNHGRFLFLDELHHILDVLFGIVAEHEQLAFSLFQDFNDRLAGKFCTFGNFTHQVIFDRR